MHEEFLDRVKAEIASLEAALSQDPIYRRIQVLRAVLREYGTGVAIESTTPTGARVPTQVPRRQGVYRKTSPERESALDFARNYLRGVTTPTPTREIFQKMEEAGVRLGGANRQNNLSAILSNSEEFTSYGRSGWMLTETVSDFIVDDDAEQPPNNDAPADHKEADDLPRLKG